jgi:type II secretory pathway component GspD/PulD (secretin)
MRCARQWLCALLGIAACTGLALTTGAQPPSEGGTKKEVRRGKPPKEKRITTYAHKCLHVRAEDAKEVLELHLGLTEQKEQKGGTPLAVVSHAPTNMILLLGPAKLVAKARKILAEADAAIVPRSLGPPFLKMYPVPSEQAELLAKVLQQVYAHRPDVKIAAVNASTLAVWGPREDLTAIARALPAPPPPRLVMKFIPLTTSEAKKIAVMLREAFPPPGAPVIEADEARNGLLVRGTEQQIQEVRDAVYAQGEPSDPQRGNMRVITLDKGSAAALAEAIKEYIEQMRPNKEKVILPAQEEAVPPKPAPQPAKEGAKQQTESAAPIIITAFGNKLIVTSGDPKALKLVQELALLLTRTAPMGEGDFEVIHLKHGSAIDIANVLDEAFNGPKSSDGGKGEQHSRPGGMMMKMMMGLQPDGGRPARVDRIRVVADPSINAVLVKASPSDMLTIRALLREPRPPQEPAPVRPWVIGPLKQAKAGEVAKILRTLYRDAAPADKFAVAVDERTNSLVLRCSAAQHEEIEALVCRLQQLPKEKP